MPSIPRETVWEFSTANFRIALEIAPEWEDPEGQFENPQEIEDIRSGRIEWFSASVIVYGPDNIELGQSHLGCCVYHNVSDFYTSHRNPDPMWRNCSLMRAEKGHNFVICEYFPSMIREAIAEARLRLKDLYSIKVCS